MIIDSNYCKIVLCFKSNQIIIIFGKEIPNKTFDTKLDKKKSLDLIPLITSIFHKKPFLSKHNKLYHTKTYLETITKIKSLNYSLCESTDNSEINEIPVKKVALCRKLLQKRVCKASSENQVKIRQSNPRPIKANNTFFCLDVKVN